MPIALWKQDHELGLGSRDGRREMIRRKAALIGTYVGVHVALLFVNAPAGAQARTSISVAAVGAPVAVIAGPGGSNSSGFVKLSGAGTLPDHSIVVADEGRAQVYRFDSSGAFEGIIGRKGNGPGEYREIDGIHLRRDTIVIIDGRAAVHLYLTPGKWLLSRRLPTVDGFIVNPAVGLLEGGRFLLRMNPVTPPIPSSVVSEKVHQVMTWDGSSAPKPLAVIPVSRQHRHPSTRASYLTLFSPLTSYAFAGDRVCYAYSREYRVRCLDAKGRSHDLVVEQRVGATVTAREVAAARRVRAGYDGSGHNKYAEPSLREHRERVAQQAAAESVHPVMGEILAAADGAIWVRQYTPAIGMADPPRHFVDEPSTWVEYGTDGKRKRAFRVPARHWVTAIDDRRIVAIVRDEDDVEEVRIFALPP